MLVDELPTPIGCELAIWVPGWRRLTPALADMAALLPIRALNETLASTAAQPQPTTLPVVAGVLAVDPFLSGSRLYGALAASGVEGVINMPSVGPADGVLGRALGAARLGPEQEIAGLAQARAHGLEPIALVFAQEDVAGATAAGIRRFVLHPGIPRGEAEIDRTLVRSAVTLLDHLRSQGREVLLYRHPDLERWLPDDGDTPGQLVWRLSASADKRQPRP